MVHHRATIMPYYHSGDENEQFETLINIQGSTKVEKYPKMLALWFFGHKYNKKHKILGKTQRGW